MRPLACLRWLAALVGVLAATGIVWAGPAQASVPDNWGFAYVNTPSGVPDVNHQAGSWPPGFVVHTTPGAPGEVFVQVPADRLQRRGGARDRGHRHRGVVPGRALAARPARTRSSRCGASSRAGHRCPRRSSVTFSQSSASTLAPPLAYGYVHFEPARGGIVTSFNSAGRGEHGDAGPDGGVDGAATWPRARQPRRGRAGHRGQPDGRRQVRTAALDPRGVRAVVRGPLL